MDHASEQSEESAQTELASRFSLDDVIKGLAQDYQDLRENKITVTDALARAAVAKQFFNGLRLVVTASKLLAGNARQLPGNDQE